MSAFIIMRIQPDSRVLYWDDGSNTWKINRKDVSRYAWSWAWQLIDNHRMNKTYPHDTIWVAAAPDADMDHYEAEFAVDPKTKELISL